MKSGKTIDISKSSLISLKAELSRKQEEIKNIRSNDSYVKLPRKPKSIVKKNSGVEERSKKDLELDPDEIDLLKKSREVLAVKSKLYDELHKRNQITVEKTSLYLVDFENKEAPSSFQECSVAKERYSPEIHDSKEDDIEESIADLDDDEWVEYTDCLGRTRKCHKSDLAEMKEIDRKMAVDVKDKRADELIKDRPPELISSDMEREMFRKKWEEQEKELLKKKDIHYEDVLFDEARAHGVGYFRFSQDEEKRQAEQELLRKVRQETEARQREARLLRERREAQRQARLIAARQRQRARLGLPPLSQQEILKEITSVKQEEKEEETKEDVDPTPIEDIESELKRTAHVRPWDVGKEKIEEPVMSQEEWIEKKRNERPDEFAPQYSKTATAMDLTKPPPLLFKKLKSGHHSSVNNEKDDTKNVSSEEAIEAGLKFIREQFELQRSSTN